MFDHYDSQDAAMHWRSKYLTRNVKILCGKSIQKTSGLSKSKLQLLGWLNH
jgi:hypothetical protein